MGSVHLPTIATSGPTPGVGLEQSFAHLGLTCPFGEQEYGLPSRTKKVAPVVPPKPKKKLPQGPVGLKDRIPENTYSNIPLPPASANATYSNIPLPGEDDLPLPPPPQLSSYSPPKNQGFPDPPEDLLTPPPDAPGNNHCSGYAGTVPNTGYAAFRAPSSASTYDGSSIYEPINPRPCSQMSNRSTYSTASGVSSLYSASGYYPSNTRTRSAISQNISNLGIVDPIHKGPGSKEAEVDHLTDLLVQSMENSNDPDFFGMCYKCGEKVLGEGSGCTAMSQIYHIRCFSCGICHKELRGLPFYNVDGKPLCEEDYLNTLEKCCVCEKPILDRILRATGKPYHPDCFTCIVCGKCLDGIPFTVDNVNRIHCIEDFHRKFAPRCCVCTKPILPEPGQQETVRVVALDKSYHVNCYRCEDCGLLLSSEGEGKGCYPLDEHILCRNCNAKRVQQLTAA